MKSILLSIRPEWTAKILNGEKTIEVRRKFPKNYVGWVYIYCTKSLPNIYSLSFGRFATLPDYDLEETNLKGKEINGKVCCRFWCDKVEDITWSFNGNEDIYSNDEDTLLEKSCLSHYELHNYLQRQLGYAIHISKLEVFDRPRELYEFKKATCDNCKNKGMECSVYDCRLTKAPQNYCYIEGEE